MELLLHANTTKQVSDFLHSPSHALIVIGPEGSGKGTLLSHLASQLLAIDEKALPRSHVLRIVPVNNAISIDEVRRAQQFMKLKTLGSGPIRRVLMIEQADTLTIESQNALLKLLEEPPVDTVILMSTANIAGLLPTIRSRAQTMQMRSAGHHKIVDYFTRLGHDISDVDHAYQISGGRLGLMHDLLDKNSQNALVDSINKARQILSLPQFERLQLVDEFVKQRDSAKQLLDALETICRAALAQNSSSNKLVSRWHRSLTAVTKAQAAIVRNANVKLLMSDLLLSL